MAFNLTVLSNLLGTSLEPDFTGVDLLIEDVGEHLYRIDRTMFHVTAQPERPEGRADQARPGQRHPRRTTPISAATKRRSSRTGAAVRASRSAAARTSATTPQPGRSVHERKSLNFPLQQHCKARGFALYPQMRTTGGP